MGVVLLVGTIPMLDAHSGKTVYGRLWTQAPPRGRSFLERPAASVGTGDVAVAPFRHPPWPVTLLVTRMHGKTARMTTQLAEHERRIRTAAATGELVDLRVGDADHDDPAHGACWDDSRTVRAELLIELLTKERAQNADQPWAIKIQGARITGSLNLEARELACPLLLRACRFEDPVILDETAAPAIRLPGCYVPSLSAEQLRTSGNLELNDGFTARGEVRLRGARVGGIFDLSGAHLTNPGVDALVADQMTVEQSMLCRDGFTAEGVVHVTGARIGGNLEFDGARIVNPGGRALDADQLTVGQSMLCRGGFTVEGAVHMSGALIGGLLSFEGAHLINPEGYALRTSQLTVKQSLHCRKGFTAEGEVRLLSARVGGVLSFVGAHLTNPDGRALNAARLTVEQSAHCRDGFVAEGEVRLEGAHIGGELDLNGAHLTNPGGQALNADQITVDRLMLCMDGFTADGNVNLMGAHIGGSLGLDGAHLTNPNGMALSANLLTVGQSMLCRGGVAVHGEVSLVGAHIGGQLNFDGAHLTNPGGTALNGEGLTIAQSMSCQNGFIAKGEVVLRAARIGGDLEFGGAHIQNAGNTALNGNGLTVGGRMSCENGFAAEGELRLPRAHIGGVLALSGRFANPSGYALTAEGLTVDKSTYCRVTALGCVHLPSARLGSHLDLRGASLANPDGLALDLEAARVGHLILRPAHRPAGTVDLTNVQVGVFDDEPATWPDSMLLRGFTYEALENDQISVRNRLQWLKLHPDGYTPQIYDQLATAYRRAGRAEAVRRVGVAKQWRRRSVFNPLNWLLYLTVGYGYRTWLAAVWLAALAVLGSWVFTQAETHHLMQPTPAAPTFQPLAYTLDVLLPIVDLGQDKTWTPHSWALYWSWALIAIGWILTTAVVAGLTGIFKRD